VREVSDLERNFKDCAPAVAVRSHCPPAMMQALIALAIRRTLMGLESRYWTPVSLVTG
jgi:hypothetical protein